MEMDTHLYDERNMLLAARSEHKEMLGNFDGFKFYDVDGVFKKLRVEMLCRKTLDDLVSVRAHWAVYLWAHL